MIPGDVDPAIPDAVAQKNSGKGDPVVPGADAPKCGGDPVTHGDDAPMIQAPANPDADDAPAISNADVDADVSFSRHNPWRKVPEKSDTFGLSV